MGEDWGVGATTLWGVRASGQTGQGRGSTGGAEWRGGTETTAAARELRSYAVRSAL